MWLALCTLWIQPLKFLAVLPEYVLLYIFFIPTLVVDEAAFARPPPVVTV